MPPKKLVEALEALQDDNVVTPTVKSMETEVVLYGVIGDPSGLEQADRQEDQIQLEGSFATGVRCRVRMTKEAEGKENYTFTYKLKSNPTDGGSTVQASEENNATIDKNFFDGFRTIAERKLVKRRYIFNSRSVKLTVPDGTGNSTEIEIPNVQYEVDVFQSTNAEAATLCKIDLEVDNILNFLSKEHPDIKEVSLKIALSNLPFKPTNMVVASSEDPAVKAFIDHFWDVCAEKLDNVKAAI